jgi:hypothetical protein
MPAATDFHVNGPTTIMWRTSSESGTYAAIGYTDNDDLIRINVRDHKRTFSRNDQGDMVGESVYSGSTATIDFTMVAWDQNELIKIIDRVRKGTTGASSTTSLEGGFATVGGVLRGSVPRTIALKIVPTNLGSVVYEFPEVMLDTGPEYMDFGNAVKRIGFSFITVAPLTGSTFITTSVQT